MAGIGLGHVLGRDHDSSLPEWSGGSSLVKTEPSQIGLLLLFLTRIHTRKCTLNGISEDVTRICQTTKKISLQCHLLKSSRTADGKLWSAKLVTFALMEKKALTFKYVNPTQLPP